eukprot:NODE_11451_length_305_cov_24.550781_g10538_i0.p1 GENE.NODE_11451_length_305_cov_24.550781_g10538_i0~~NODE_11451_length_305_cov_24.550781_g10538_i0.p1  ORF type:complete len:84 (-),score=16.66 NODE_11451_length_305_cov_24.550781_g10538_i0:52-279(-)
MGAMNQPDRVVGYLDRDEMRAYVSSMHHILLFWELVSQAEMYREGLQPSPMMHNMCTVTFPDVERYVKDILGAAD